MFSYRKIVFGIKQCYQINNVLNIISLQRYCSILISQHNATDDDYCCDRSDVHYHGIVEFNGDDGKIGKFLMELLPYCIYMKDSHCSSPAEYLAYITLAPKQTIYQEFLDSSKLVDYLQTPSSWKLEVLGRKRERRISNIERDNKVVELVHSLLKGVNVLNKCNKNDEITETAVRVSQKIVLNSSILVLSNRFEAKDGYLSPEESAQFVLNWCSYQKLDPKSFVKSFIRCLDKKCGNRNSIYLQGSRNSGKTYIVQSIIEACIYVGQVMVESTAYPFVWEKCVDKRLIVMKEPNFSMTNFDQLDKILSGSGTLIHRHNDLVDYLQPTPVIIVAKDHDWLDKPELSEKIKRRFHCCYMNLENYPVTNEKKLHPQWLNILNKSFSSKSSSKDDRKDTKEDSENTMQSNSKYAKRPMEENRIDVI